MWRFDMFHRWQCNDTCGSHLRCTMLSVRSVAQLPLPMYP